MKNAIYILGVFTLLAQAGCNAPNPQSGDHAHEESQERGSVVLTDVQMANASIKIGGFDTMNVSGYLRANGHFDLPPANVAAVTAPMEGTVKQANFLVGSYVKKGEVLALLTHPGYIKMQEEYLNALLRLEFLGAEFQRQKALDSANIAALKSLQQAKADYQSAQTRKLSLEKQLEYIGINPKRLANGKMTATISLRAPFSGHITRLNVHKGEFVTPEQELYEMINTDHMHMELNVYEKDISKVKKGQTIRFTVPSLGTTSYKGTVFLVGHSFDRESKTVKVHGHIEQSNPEVLMRGLYLEATIFTGNQHVLALPEEAVILNEGKSYIYVQGQVDKNDHKEARSEQAPHDAHKEGTQFLAVEVATGIRRNGMVEIRPADNLDSGASVVISGAYDLFSETKKGEGGHHH